MICLVPWSTPYYRRAMRKPAALCLALLSLSGCVAWSGRMPGTTDAHCMRMMMRHGAGNAGPLDFTGAASRCVQFAHPVTEGDNPPYAPLDLRDDPALQAMAENPAVNDAGYPFIPRNSTTPRVGARWQIVH
ncbi:hypothetical protein Tasa_048_098 [Tanticharoenia sakaeratensis NBRC 103193]|uniref:Lipoprotein n=2 Tax=Tanticharoenia TaxID=444052 RepID=A0A0D6MQB8_9PROT|nr:hypothetical protein Tasa_048_098 [Tanticharoenia sakaeratensis NBRC 103193]GBQ21978.1 hypothetical protein AA103193_1913 [Tanticharoenia sakaeratensis NBRC 103193]